MRVMVLMKHKVLAVDWGSKRIGLAIYNPDSGFSKPLCVIPHQSLVKNAERITKICIDESVKEIIVGVTYNDNGELSPSGRSAKKLADELASQMHFCEVRLWDEDFTTNDAKSFLVRQNVSRQKRRGHQDALTAVILLDDYLSGNEI